MTTRDMHSNPFVMGTVTPATETAQRQRLNLNVIGEENAEVMLNCGARRRRRASNDRNGAASKEVAADDQAKIKERPTATKRCRFDFTRLAESATRRDDGTDTETSPNNGDDDRVKVHDDDQSARRLSLKPMATAAAAAVQDDDKRSLFWPLSEPPALLPIKSVFNPTESLNRYYLSVFV